MTVILSAVAGWCACRAACGPAQQVSAAPAAPSLAPRPAEVEGQKKVIVEQIRQRMERKLVFA
eukprot:CAMPEP_0173444406 /NCGR_PEP_ID=MMETSP1357-20121228/32108_2 /TAXON_ID=77926 /ORGANISM="Hemiselmis rufescens, Strain PCC563" /LENGTH=62 /DNA_ID=CAMNT_0014410449 /DNA_START=79 /DNA_END=267 /DNA_ORIENTATION=-